MTRSYTFNGYVKTEYKDWEEWINDGLLVFKMLGYDANYYDIGIVNKAYGKIKPIKGLIKKIENVKKKEELIKGMTMLALPKNFSSAAFDFIITLSRGEDYITLIINQEFKVNIDETAIIPILQRNIEKESGEIYEMDILECPEVYARKLNSKETFKSLNIIAAIE